MRRLRTDEKMALAFLRDRQPWVIDDLEHSAKPVFEKILRGLVNRGYVSVQVDGVGPVFSLTAMGETEMEKYEAAND